MSLKDPIIDFIRQQGGSTKEHSLLAYIKKNAPEFFSCLGNKPSLYKKHFCLFNHLYKQKEMLARESLCLLISAVDIRICSSIEGGKDIGETDALSEFYLDSKNMNLSEEQVKEMMSGFWIKYLALDEKSAAIKILKLENTATINKKTLKAKFNELAKIHHPDRGGDEQEFIKIKSAYNQLKLLV